MWGRIPSPAQDSGDATLRIQVRMDLSFLGRYWLYLVASVPYAILQVSRDILPGLKRHTERLRCINFLVLGQRVIFRGLYEHCHRSSFVFQFHFP